ncbi:Moesin/ezrin/radixin homolog 1 [Caenorhabditis elegans]|uniref:Moesin/ezrin/radixin homolog 1 n=2 Tax=Caenorhabditis elegans TaxID=6239 RepID=G5EBP4_CAEEL|nr:Moesin/ezrin/radixin homolog 1 [Caenorhabditis elegans]CAD91717.1 Moesin/ezrin/radixin homolog 1 [Caenorhabditis elegans]|eukprot:NP_001021866.1 FERM domain (protein4.1-ezrin-radixin-moesin) family [Caenorhabditis elegans]
MESTETLGSEQMGTDRDPGDQKHPTTSQQPRDSKMQLAKVLLPDGVQKEFEVNKNSEGEALFRQVTRDLSIEEREYFSLCFYDKDEGTRHWLYNDKNIAKQIKGLPWEFSFEVKFYPTTPTTIVDDHARYYVFLQLRRDLLTGRLPATADTHSLLGSFVAQIEFGDAPAEMTDAYEQFIVASKLVPSAQANPETYKKIVDLHREMRGQTPSEAENQFLDHCKHLALYGIHLFKAISDKDKKPVDVGIGAAGINIYQDEQKTHSFSWQNIIKIGYRRTYFSIKLKAGTVEKNEKTLYFKLPNHVAAKRTWKCAVEHHTFFRLIQPEDKTHKSFFNFGSQRFRYQGRTQFQTKIASQMFDKPSTVDRAPSAMSQPIATAENQKLQTLNLTDSELEQRQFERYRRALTPKSYTSSRQDDDAVSTATFAKYSRPSTLLVVSTSGHHQQSPHELSYSPRGDDSSNYSSAAYYMSERSSLRTPSSAYYPPSEYTSPTSPVYFEGQHHGEYHVQMRQTASTSATGPSNSGARRNLFGRASDARSSQASRDSVRLVSFHEPVDPNEPIPNTYPYSELPQIPIERIVHVYHEGHYDRLSPRRQQRPELPYGFGNYTPRNGVSHVDNLQPDGEMDQQPIRFYVDVRHSGASRRNLAKRLSHPGKEDIKEQIDPKDYYFSASLASDPIHRTELSREVQPANIQQYTRRYHHGDSIHKPDTPQYRLITHVHPLAVTNRDGRDGQSSSNLNATISQREQVVSTKVRRESPDADRRVRLSASVDRSGNLTDTTEEMTRSTNEAATPTTVVTTRIVEKKGKGKKNNQKIPPSSNKTDHASFEGQEKRSRFGGFFTKKTSQTLSGYPESTSQFTGELDATHRDDDLEPSTFSHSNKSQQYSSKQDKTIITSVESKSDSGNKKRLMAVESPEVPKKYRLIARIRHEGDEDVVEKPEKYSFVTDSHSGMLEETYRQKELDQIPISSHAAVYHHGKSWSIQRQSTLSQDRSKISSLGADDANLSKKKEVRLIARIESKTEEVAHKKHKKEGSSVFGFFNRPTKLPAGTEYPEKSNVFTGDLDTTGRTSDLEQHPFQHGTHPAYSPKNVEAYQPSENSNGESKTDIPAAYGFPSTSYDGPLETTSLERDLQHVTIAAHSNVYHHGDSSRIEKHASPVATPEKKQKKVKSPKKEKVDVPAEPEKKEIRLIARVRTEPEAEIVDVPVVKETKEKKGDSKSKLPTFGFFSKTTKTTKTTGYPETSEAYTGELDTTDRTHDFEGTSFEHGEHPAYSPKQTVIEAIETPAEPEKKRYRLIARFRHEGDEDVVEKPDPYQIATTLYDGPLDEISRETDLDHAPIADHANVYHHGDSSRIEKHASPVATLEKKQKKVKSPKKEKVDVPAEPEKKEIRLIARVRTEPEAEIVDVPVVKETKEKKGDSKSKLPTFGFFSKTTKTTKTTGYPETSEAYTGELDTTDRTHDLEGTSFEHGEHPAYSPKQTVIEAIETPAEPEKKRYRLIARFRHEGDEDVVEKPDPYQIATTLYDGPLDEISRETDLDHTPIADHANVYHHGDSSRIEKHASPVATPEKKQKKVKSPKKEKVDVPAEPEKKEIRLIARVRTEPEAEIVDVPVVKETKEKKGDSKSKLPTFGFFSKTTKTTKTTGYPETSEAYTEELDTTDRIHDLEGTSFEHGEHSAYSPKQTVIETIETPAEPEKKRYRLIARFRHEGDEDVVEKPDPYQIATTLYDGPLDEISRETDLDHAPIADHANVYHHGDSSRIEKHASPVATLEKKQKKVKSPKKEKVDVPAEPEKKEIRLIARVRTEPEAEIVDVPVVKETKEKKGDSKSKLPTFGFFSKTTKTTKTTGYPETSEAYTGELDTTDRIHDLEGTSFEHGEHPAYSPKQTVIETIETPAEPEKKRYRLIARFRHEGDEDVVEKPDPYQIATTLYDGPLDEISRETDLDHTPIADHANVYHHGDSSRIEKHASPVATLEKKQKKVKSPKKEKVDVPAEPEKKEIRLIARVRTEPEAEIVDVPVVKETKEKKGDSKSKLPTFGFFSKTTKTTKTTGYPETSEAYTGELDTTDRTHDLEGTSFEHGEHPAYSPKQTVIEAIETPAEPEKKRYRLIARFRHEGDEDVVEKPDPYQIATTLYDGPLDEISRETDLDHAPIADHANVYHHGDSSRIEKHASPVATLEKKQKKVKSPKKEKVDVPAEPEKKEIRLIARVRTEPEAEIVDVPVVKETKEKKGDSKSKLPTFGFFSKTTKTTKTTGYPETSEAYTGELDTTDRIHDLEGTSFEHGEHPAYSPKQTVIETIETPAEPEKKRYRLIARFRHEGDEDVVEKPDPYQIATTLYDGPLDEISRETDLDHTPIADHANVYHHGDSSRIEKHASPVATLEKKQKKVKSPKKEKVDVPAEPEKKEIRLIARVRTEPEAEIVDVPVVKETKEKKGDSKSKLPTFGFFSKTTKTTKTTGYPETSEAYTGELDTTDRTHDLEGTSFEHGEHPAYSPKQTVIEAIETPAEPEKKRYRLIARFRHEGDEDVVEKPDPYQIATTLYDGPLDEISRETDLDHAPIADHANVYHHGDSSRIEKHASPVATLEKKQKKVKSPKKEKVDVPAEPEKKEIRLIARVRTEPEAEIVDVPVVKETKEKKGDSKSKLPTFGFFSKTTKTTKTTGYPETSEAYTGELDTTDRIHDLEGTSFEHGEHPAYSPKQTVIEAIETPAEPEKKRYRLIARFRHEGDEDVVEKPDPYQIATTLYDGPLDEISRETDLDHTPIADHANVYHHGDSSRIEKHASPVATPEKKQKKVKSPKKEKVDVPAEPEKKEIRLIARVRTEPEAEIVDVPVVKETKEKKGDSKSKLPTFGFFSKTTKTTKTTGYPETSEAYTGELDTTDRIHDLEGTSFEHGEHPAYSPKQTVIETIETPAEPEKKRYRLIARFRHEGDEDVVEKPDPYQIATTLYDGPLDEISRETDLDHTPIADHANVYHHGDSSRIEKHASPVATLEKKQKKVKSPKKEKVDVPAEPEKKEIRLIARVRTEPEAEIVDVPVVKETKEKKGDSKSKLPTFGFFSKTTKTTKTTGYPETSEAYTGELDTTDRTHDLEGTSFEHGEHPAYSPKQTVIEAIETPAEPEKKRYRLIARFRHEGDEDVVEKPDPYQIATTLYDGPLDEISRETDLDHTPIADHANVYHHGDSSRIEKHASPVATLEKKQKKVKSPKKEKVDVPAEPEKKEIRLIARVRTEPEAEIVDVPVVKETKEKKGDSKSKLPTFGFFSKTTKTTKTTGYPETSEAYTGELDTTDRTHDLEGTSFEHGEHPAFEASSTSITIEAFDPSHEKVIKKPSRFHWFSRWRHEGDEDVVEKPEGYILSSEIYEGPYDNMRPIGELELTPILDHSQVYHNGESGKLEKRSSKEKRIKTPSPERVEPSEIKLVARIQPLEHVEDSEISEKLSPVKDRSRAPSFSMFHRQSKQRGYPEISPLYEGNLDVTGRAAEVENTPIEVRSVPEYHPKQEVSAQHPESSQPNRFYRLIARWRHEGDEDEIEKPDAYKFVTEVYEGPLDDIRPVVELAQDPISDHSQVYHNGESWKAEKNIKPPKPVRNTKKGLSPEPIESEVHEIRLLTRVASSSEEPEEVDVIPAESTPVKPFRLRFLSIGKKSPTSPDSEFPECSPQYDGPVDLTSRSDELEVMPYLHGSVPPYSPKFTPVKKVDKADEERKKYTVIYRFRHEGEEDFADKPEAYGFSSDVYTGSLNEISRSSELEHAAIHDHSQVYHDGLSYKIDNKQKKSKDRTELEEPKTSRLVARVLPQQEASDSGSPKKDDKDKGFRFRFFSKASPKSSGYPEVSPTFEGPIDVTGRVESLEHVPLQSREFPTYSPRKSQEKPSEKSSERTVEPKRYHLIARIRHEGDEETVENPDTYGFASTSYDGPLEETSKSVDVEETPISVYSNVYHHGESIRVEKRQRKAKISAEPEKDDDQENVPPKSRFSFLRGGQKRVLSYPSTLYSGPLETTDRDLDLENIPLSIPVHGSSDQHARKYRLIARIRHAGDEDEVAAHKLHPVFYSFPAVQYSGILEKTALCKEVDEVPIGRFARVYHSGSSGGLIWNLLKNRNSRASKDMDEPKRKRKDQKDQKDIKLIARVLPMKKTPEKSDRFEKATKEEPLREAELVRSTQSEAQGNISTVSYIPSSLTYDVPRPARIEGYTYGGDCYVEIRHERRAEVHLEPVYVLQETNARSHAYLSTATAVFSGASTSAAAADSGANSSTNTTSHSLVLPSFAASVSEDETGIHHFSWTPLHMSPQPEKMSFLARLGFKRDKSNKKDKKKRKKGENETSGETSDSEHDEKREFAIVEFEPESGQPYTTVSTWQETSDLPEQVEVYTDENGRQITRTVKSSQVKHTVQTQSFQNYIVDGDQVPVGVVDVERSREQLTPLGQKASSSTSSDVQNGGGENGGIVETQTRTMTYEAQGGENSAPPGWAEEGLGEYVSSKSVTQGNRTIETITYKTEKDGIVETHVEHRVTIHSDGDIDHDAELSQAILEATQMNPDMVVEKIEVRQETTQ